MATVCAKREDLELLVDELLKKQPNKQTIKKLSAKLGLDYSVDPLTQMNIVLQSMNALYLGSQKRKELEN